VKKINRLNEFNKIWIRLTVFKIGDVVKFKVKGKKKIHKGKITAAFKYGNTMRYQVWSLTTLVQNEEIEIIECNGVKFQKVIKSDVNRFKRL
jgi:hypothetical protein